MSSIWDCEGKVVIVVRATGVLALLHRCTEVGRVVIRDYGRGIPLGKVVDVVSKINTGAKYDSGAFQKSVGLNGVGTKAVNALSGNFRVQSVRDGRTTWAEFQQGNLKSQKNND